MTDTDIYETIDNGTYEKHTPAPWTIVCSGFAGRYYLSEAEERDACDAEDWANAELMQDAPLILQALIDERAEVKRLRERLIDTDKYEGHTPAPWTLEHLEDDEGQQWFEIPAVHYTTKQSGDGSQQEYADARLMADAPLFFAEVKRLRERLIRAYDWAENAVNGNDSAMMDYTEYVCGGEEELEKVIE